MCVLKFPNEPVSKKQITLDGTTSVSPLCFEKMVWDQIYPEFRFMVLLEEWSGRETLKMPHFPAIPVEQRRQSMNLVREALSLFDERGLIHCDVAWRNMGIWLDNQKSLRVIVYDLRSVRNKEDGDVDWINQAIRRLQS